MPGKKLDRQSKGQIIRATTINQIVDGANWMSRFNVAPGFGMISTAAGPVVYDARPQKIWAKLSGTTSPYSWSQVYGGGDGTFTVLSGGLSGTTNASEYNSHGGLNNVIVQLEQWGALDFRFFAPSRTSYPNPCIGSGNSLSFQLLGCPTNSPVPGASVDFILGGATIFSGTTDGSGSVSVSGAAPGSYTISWTYGSLSGSTSATISGACSSASRSANLVTVAGASNYGCCSFGTGCLLPLPKTLFITDSNGTTALSLTSLGSRILWRAVLVGPPSIEYQLDCDGTLTAIYCSVFSPCFNCSPPTGNSGPLPGNTTDAQRLSLGSLCNYPFAGLSGTWTGVGGCGYGTGIITGPFTIVQ
jgi:hypothetical protein